MALVVGCVSALAEEGGWPHYGGSLAGDRYAPASAITPENVEDVALAWTYRTGDGTAGRGFDGNPSRMRATPILVQGKLIISTGFNRVYALHPATGEEIWKYDPKVDFARSYSEMFVSRSVAAWPGPASVDGPCAARVFLGTLDSRLIAIDADTGVPCTDFGDEGEVDLSVGIRRYYKWDYSVTSPPTVVGEVVVVGSAVGDNGAAELQPGTVRGYDVRDGSLVWAWDPLPRGDDHPAAESWTDPERNLTGGGECLERDGRRPGARPRLPAHHVAVAGFLRRQAPWRQRLRQLGGRAACIHWRVRLGLPDRPP